MPKLAKLISLWTLLAWLVSACGSTATPTPTAPPPTPVVLRVGWMGKPDSLNPAYAFLGYAYAIFDLVYTPLVTEGPEGKYVGGLAKTWTHSEDGLTWTFTLKDNIAYHNGTPLTAADVAWSINAVINNPDGWASTSNYANGFVEATATDPKTVQITLANPIANMEYRLSFLYALYRQDFEGFTTVEDLQNFANNPLIGTGPFKLNRFDSDKGILILDRNPDYFDGQSQLDQIIFQAFDNSDALVQAIKVGDIDAAYEVPASAFATVKGFANVRALNQASRSFDELILNTVAETNDPAPTGNPALQDPVVRQAIELAINKQDLVDIVWQGLAKPGNSIIAPVLGGGFWYNPNLIDPAFDLERANQLLEEAGYVKGADGVRAKGAVRLEMRLQFDAAWPEYARVADLLAGWFSQIGLRVNPEPMQAESLVAATTGVGDYDLVIWGWGADPDPDFMLSTMTTDQFVAGGWSDSGYHNPEYDQLYLDQQLALDPAERQKIIWQMQELIFRDKPYIVLYNYDRLQAYRTDKFTNFIETSPAGGITMMPSLLQVEAVK